MKRMRKSQKERVREMKKKIGNHSEGKRKIGSRRDGERKTYRQSEIDWDRD